MWGSRAEVLFKTEPGGGPSGLRQDEAGRFWVCLYSGRKLVQFSSTGAILREIDSFGGIPFKGPNDLTLDSGGGVYFTDGGDFEDDWRTGRPAGKVYYLNPSGELTLADTEICFPNGIACSKDRKTLFVNEHRNNRTLKYDIQQNGTLSGKTIFYVLDTESLLDPDTTFELGPDGMCLDRGGCLWIAHYGGGKLVHIGPDGSLLGAIHLPQGVKPTNAVLHPDESALYVTEAELGLLYRIDLRQL
jgi:gluconolactonase